MHKIKKGLSIKTIVLIWVIGLAGQLCWNIENQWFNMYIYKYFGYDNGTDIITGMVILSSIATAFSTFLFGTWSDRLGKRKPFICFGYMIWGVFTFLFGLTHKLNGIMPVVLMITIVILADAIMSFFGSMGNDSGFSAWTTDLLNEDSKGAIGLAIAAQPVIGTIAGTVVGGIIVASLGYEFFFGLAGLLISIIGFISLFLMKDVKNVKKNVNGSFWKQFFQSFRFKEFFKIKELVLVNVLIAIFFIGFNCFFNYIGNLYVYNYEFNEAEFGYIQGVALVIAIVIMILVTSRFKKDRSPLIVLIAICAEIIGLLTLTIISRLKFYDNSNLLSPNNIVLLIGVIFIGFGYVTFMQTSSVWAKSLYPSDNRGQFEGIKILSFVLIPMIFGSLISKFLITNFGTLKDYVDSQSGQLITGGKVPNEALFIASIVFMLLALIPLYFVNKKHKQRIENDVNNQHND